MWPPASFTSSSKQMEHTPVLLKGNLALEDTLTVGRCFTIIFNITFAARAFSLQLCCGQGDSQR